MMNSKVKKWVSGYVLFVVIFGLWSCHRSEQGSSLTQKTLTLGLSADYPPFEFKNKGEIVGFDVDLAEEIGRELGRKIVIQDMDFSALIPALQAGRIDCAMSGFTITEERKKNIDFSEIYFNTSFALLVKKESAFSKSEDFKGKRIGAQLGTTMEKYGKEQSQLYPGMEILALGKNPVLIQELKSGRLDGVLSEEIQAVAFAQANPALRYVHLSESNEGYVAAFRLKSQLKDQFNFLLSKLKNTGKIDQLRKKWLGK